jgi:hypothetical protein
MSESDPEDFACPQCGSRYKLVRVKPGPRTTNLAVHCIVCGYSLAPRDGEDVLKYFLITSKARRLWLNCRVDPISKSFGQDLKVVEAEFVFEDKTR